MNRGTSAYLDLLRFLCAAIVILVHADWLQIDGRLPLVWRLPGAGHDAVIVFFVLSGFVIAHVAQEREHGLRDYALSRLARLWSVALPALLLTLAADALGQFLAPDLYQGRRFAPTDLPAWRLAASALFVNELWFVSIRPLSNIPFWSLGYEAWYYAIFAALFYLRGRARWIVAAAAALVAGPKILLLLPVWGLGVLAYRAARTQRLSPRAGAGLALGAVAVYLAYRWAQGPQATQRFVVGWLGDAAYAALDCSQTFLVEYVVGVLVALHLVGISAAARGRNWRLPGVAYLASFSFSMYLFHFPLLLFFLALAERLQLVQGRAAFILGGTLAVIWLLGTVTERRKGRLRQWLARVADRLGSRPAPVGVESVARDSR